MRNNFVRVGILSLFCRIMLSFLNSLLNLMQGLIDSLPFAGRMSSGTINFQKILAELNLLFDSFLSSKRMIRYNAFSLQLSASIAPALIRRPITFQLFAVAQNASRLLECLSLLQRRLASLGL